MQCRRLFPPTKASAELNAMFAASGFGWLVGEMELKTGDVVVGVSFLAYIITLAASFVPWGWSTLGLGMNNMLAGGSG